jgi:hypothetical protein
VAGQDMTIKQGVTWRYIFYYRDPTGAPIDITGYEVHGEIRSKKTGDSRLLATISFEITDAPAGEFTGEMSATDTSAIDRSGYYDVELTDTNGEVVRIRSGRVLLDTEVTTS